MIDLKNKGDRGTELLTTKEICAVLQCSKTSIARWIRAGWLPQPIQLMPKGTRFWVRSDIENLLAKN